MCNFYVKQLKFMNQFKAQCKAYNSSKSACQNTHKEFTMKNDKPVTDSTNVNSAQFFLKQEL